MAAIALPAAPLTLLLADQLDDGPFVLVAVLVAGLFGGLLVLAHRVRERIDPTYDAGEALRGARPGSMKTAALALVVALAGVVVVTAAFDDVSRAALFAVAVVCGLGPVWTSEHLAAR
jgi:hypothetical protein